MVIILISILSVFLVSASALFKYQLTLHPITISFSLQLIIDNITTLLRSYYIWLSLFFTVLASLTWIYIINKYPLSQVYPMISVAYVLMMLVDYFIFKQPITTTKIAGVASIFLGVWLLSR